MLLHAFAGIKFELGRLEGSAHGPPVATTPRELGMQASIGLDRYRESAMASCSPARGHPAGADTQGYRSEQGMTDINVDELGPVDYLVVGFPAEKANFSGEMASELKALIDSNTIRVLDLVMIMKGEDGSVEASELRDADDSEIGELRALERDLAILLAEEDVEEIGASLEPGSAAAVLVWENTLGGAVRLGGAQVGR